ncbi:helix-turn-helix transcriptional regulator [Pseudomonas mendocina]|jgi:AraC-like DNA-binding protein|uniref:AraC family transcriptional regulator n=1 Tax=Ectopseudomonas mendocina TaxID=300 RepID=UPI0023DC4F98|nr:helix-turn-helix transcriptional regulator [Pseudomonas mendocina]MDF2077514.1 helix-turn-helix transcriptional regulator [Pseudomonas mendocina]
MVDHTALPYESLSMPVTGVAIDYPSGHQVPSHSHPCAQLIYAIEGVLVVDTPAGRWVTPPTRGVWLQAGCEHSLQMRGVTRVRSLFVNPDAAPGLPAGNCVIDVSPLLRELIQAATLVPAHYPADSRDGRLMRFLLDELSSLPVLPLHLPWPDDARIARVCQSLADNPAQAEPAEYWAKQLAMSSKTFHRHFQRSTGITFGRWRQQARLLLSLEALAQGLPVLQVALQHGYDSQSAFAAAFRRQFGVPPSAFYR